MKEIKRGSDMCVKWEGVHGEETRGGRERGGRREKEHISENRNKARGLGGGGGGKLLLKNCTAFSHT